MRELLLSCQDLAKAFGAPPLFEGVSFGIFEGDHVGLVGPNGAGKSTLLRIVAGVEEADSGTRAVRKGIRIGYVPQDPVFAPGRTIEDMLEDALSPDVDDAERVSRVALAVAKAGFPDRQQRTDELSGGW